MNRSIFEFKNYREYLRFYYEGQKAMKTGMTYARFSSLAGVKSPNLLKQAIDGTKGLTAKNARRFAEVMGLLGDEIDYFEALVHFNQAKQDAERIFFEERMRRILDRAEIHRSDVRHLSNEEFRWVSDWRYWALMTLTNVPGFEERGHWISERLEFAVSPLEAEKMLIELTQWGLLERTENGRLVQAKSQVQTKPELGKSLSRVFYDGLLNRASSAVKTTDPNHREFGCYFTPLSPEQLPELKRKVREFLSELYLWAHENQKPSHVYALQFGAFPLTNEERK